jgi:hypothetical protein
MDTLDQHRTTIGRFAWFSAWFALVMGQLHALARHRTEDGAADLDLPLTAAWAEPAGDLLSPLLDWADPDLVYVTYGKLWLPVFVAFFLCALVSYRSRRPRGFERGAWRVVLVGYGAAVVSVFGEYWTQWTGEPNALLDIVFLASIPAILVTMLGSSVLGIALVRNGFRPRAAAWLLVATFPSALVITSVTSMGNIVLPIAFAFGLIGRQLAAEEPVTTTLPTSVPAS